MGRIIRAITRLGIGSIAALEALDRQLRRDALPDGNTYDGGWFETVIADNEQ